MMPGLPRSKALIALLLLALTPLAPARTLREIEQSGSLRLCLAGSSADFYHGNGEALARYLGVAAEFIDLKDWNAQFENGEGQVVKEAAYTARRFADGSCDVFPNDLYIVPWRQSKMTLVPYYMTRKVVVANRDLRSAVRHIDDLQGRRAAIQRGTAYDSWLLEQNAGRFAADPVVIDYYPTDEAMRAVAERRADFTVIGSEGSFKWVRSDEPRLDVRFAVGPRVAVGWGIHPAAADLEDRLEQFFADNNRRGSELDRAWQEQYDIPLTKYHQLYDSFDSPGLDPELLLRWGIPAGIIVLALFAAGAFRNRMLKREVEQRRSAEERIAALLDEQTRFFSFVAHELRNPLGVIVTGSANLRLGLADANDSIRQRIERIERATQRLSALIDRHLRLQRLTRADFALDVDACAPQFPALEALALVAEAHPGRPIETTIASDLPAAIRVDSNLVTLALGNLLDNAIKYSPPESPITLSIENGGSAPPEVVYRVSDRGCGISADDRQRLFAIYARQTGNRHSGFGIGLALVANIARRHGGSVDCDSTAGVGSTFTLRLPVERPPRPAPGASAAAPCNGWPAGPGAMRQV